MFNRVAQPVSLFLFFVFAFGDAMLADESSTELPRYRDPVQIATLEHKKVTESSGLAASWIESNRFWTHNDSGDKPRIYCFDIKGQHIATTKVKKAGAIDWEDMCSFKLEDQSWLLIGDVGDNGTKRKSVRLYLMKEPTNPGKDIDDVHIIKLGYSTGPMDCEAIAVDTQSRKLLLVEKKRWVNCRVFETDMVTTDTKELVAKPIAQINVPLVTALDISPDGRRALVLTLGQAFEYRRNADETWKVAFSRKPRTINMPPRKQGESVCYGNNGVDIFLTSEFSPTPLFMVAAESDSNSSGSAAEVSGSN